MWPCQASKLAKSKVPALGVPVIIIKLTFSVKLSCLLQCNIIFNIQFVSIMPMIIEEYFQFAFSKFLPKHSGP